MFSIGTAQYLEANGFEVRPLTKRQQLLGDGNLGELFYKTLGEITITVGRDTDTAHIAAKHYFQVGIYLRYYRGCWVARVAGLTNGKKMYLWKVASFPDEHAVKVIGKLCEGWLRNFYRIYPGRSFVVPADDIDDYLGGSKGY